MDKVLTMLLGMAIGTGSMLLLILFITQNRVNDQAECLAANPGHECAIGWLPID